MIKITNCYYNYVIIIIVIFIHVSSSSSSSLNKRNNNHHGNENKIWNFKFSFTTTINSQLSIDCLNDDQIWIGWSHYGTRSPFGGQEHHQKSSSSNNNNINSRHLEASVSSSSIRNSQFLNL